MAKRRKIKSAKPLPERDPTLDLWAQLTIIETASVGIVRHLRSLLRETPELKRVTPKQHCDRDSAQGRGQDPLIMDARDLPPEALADEEPARDHALPPADYAGPWRVWGPVNDIDTDRHDWTSEIVAAKDGPFNCVHPHAHEWWNGKAWIGEN